MKFMLEAVLALPIVFATVLVVVPALRSKKVALGASIAVFAFSTWSVVAAKLGRVVSVDLAWIPFINAHFELGLDRFSGLLTVLVTGIVALIVLVSRTEELPNAHRFYALLFAAESALLGVFLARDAFLFYVFWELVLIPLYFAMLGWGGDNVSRVTLRFFLYTFAGSFLMLIAFIFLYLKTPGEHSFNISVWQHLSLTSSQQSLVFLLLFIAFAIKLPLFPFHGWQADLYESAPLPLAMFLGALVSKMGIFGMQQFLLPITPHAIAVFSRPLLFLVAIGSVYAALQCLEQNKFQRFIAYASLSHLGLMCAGILAQTAPGIAGVVILVAAHSVSTFAFLAVGLILWRRTNTMTVSDWGGVKAKSPFFSTCFLLVVLGYIALPLTGGFAGEFLVLFGVFRHEPWVAGILGSTVVLGAWVTLKLFQRAALGEPSSERFAKLTFSEQLALGIAIGATFAMGIFPRLILVFAKGLIEAVLP